MTARELIEQLHRARLTLASLHAEVAQAEEAFNAAHGDLFQRRELAVIEADEATAGLRKAALTAFKETGDLHPLPGVNVRMMTRLEYEDEEAFRWATTHKMALKLDAREFEKLAKAAPARFEFVRIYQEPSTAIAGDLGPVLDVMKE